MLHSSSNENNPTVMKDNILFLFLPNPIWGSQRRWQGREESKVQELGKGSGSELPVCAEGKSCTVESSQMRKEPQQRHLVKYQVIRKYGMTYTILILKYLN